MKLIIASSAIIILFAMAQIIRSKWLARLMLGGMLYWLYGDAAIEYLPKKERDEILRSTRKDDAYKR